MPSPQYENLRQMIDNVLEDYPHYEESIVRRKINDHLRNLISRRPWSGLIKYNIMSVPAPYVTGLVNVTLGNRYIVGIGTGWPTNDIVNTTLSLAVGDTGYQETTPVSMTGIIAGRWLLVGQGTANEETVFVISTTATTFVASYTKTHAAAETVLCSSLAGLQFRPGFYSPFYTVTGVPTATSIILDKPWGSPTATNSGYSISTVYVSFGQDAKMIFSIVNQARSWQLFLHAPKAYLDHKDPRRQNQGSVYMAVFHETDPAGAPLWELYPRPNNEQVFPYFYQKHWAPLENDLDILPNGIRSDVIVKKVKSEAARWPKHRILEGGIYYDTNISLALAREAEMDIEQMQMDDDNTNIMRMFWEYQRFRFGDEFWQSHDPESFYGEV